MAVFTTSHYLQALTFTLLLLKTLAFDPVPLFSFANFEKDPKFKPNVALFGDAKVVNGGYGVQLSGSGSVMYKRPIKLVEGNNKPRQFVSFSTYFAFSMPLSNWGGLAFVMVPNGSKGEVFENFSSGYPLKLKNRRSEVVGVEFSGRKREGNASCNVAINAGSSVSAKEINTSFVKRSGEQKLHAWIDYEANSMRLEVRLSQHGNKKPSDPFLWHSIDLSNVLKKEEMFVGIISPVNGSNNQEYFVYSWSFVLRHFPHSMHSEPLDPKVLVKDTETPQLTKVKVKKPRSDNCVLRVLAAMIFGTGCGALTAFVVLYLWTIFGNRHNPVVPVECALQPLDNVEYRKVKVVVDRTIEDGKKVDL